MSAAAADKKPATPTGPALSMGLFLKYGFGGAMCCSITHSAVVPLDVVKTRLQTDPVKYNKGMIHGFRTIVAEEGAGMLLQGLGPTAVGYAMQGFFKFGFYEVFKKKYADFAGDKATAYRVPIWLAASATAETIADLALCPMEATRIRLVADPSFAKGLPGAFGRILKEEGLLGLYKGLPPILLKQVPYTMAKFAVFEFAAENIYRALGGRQNLSDSTQLTVSFVSGIISGVTAAIVSQPADTVLSKINQEKTDAGVGRAIINIMKRLGVSGLFLGVGTRCVMVGTLTAGQFFIYDYIKQALGIAPAKK